METHLSCTHSCADVLIQMTYWTSYFSWVVYLWQKRRSLLHHKISSVNRTPCLKQDGMQKCIMTLNTEIFLCLLENDSTKFPLFIFYVVSLHYTVVGVHKAWKRSCKWVSIAVIRRVGPVDVTLHHPRFTLSLLCHRLTYYKKLCADVDFLSRVKLPWLEVEMEEAVLSVHYFLSHTH